MEIFTLSILLKFFYYIYCLTNTNFAIAHRVYVRLYCKTAGKIDKFFNERIYNSNRGELNLNGYVKYEKNLDAKSIEKLLHFSNNSIVTNLAGKESFFDSTQVNSTIYRYSQNEILNNEEVQSIICDNGILEIVENYFGSAPYLDMVDMWWSTDFQKEASKDAAQWFHFDLDRVNWLKVFIYLTDVEMDSGPHCYVEGSHKAGQKPDYLLEKGYSRISDKEIIAFYGKQKVKYLTGKKGSIFIGNTKAWHKGTNIKHGNRLVLQLQFTDSFFLLNPTYGKVKVTSNRLKEYLNKNPKFLKTERNFK